MSITLSTIKDLADTVQAVATVIAIIIGGIWTYWLFVRKRQSYPRAKIEHRVSHRLILGNKVLLSVDITISNIGDVLISLDSAEIRVSQMLPPEAELLDIVQGTPGFLVTNWQTLGPVQQPEWKRTKPEIEPGESTQFPYHFVIGLDVQTVLVYSYFRNVEKPGRNLGWELTTIYDLPPSNVKQPSGVVQSLKGWIFR